MFDLVKYCLEDHDDIVKAMSNGLKSKPKSPSVQKSSLVLAKTWHTFDTHLPIHESPIMDLVMDHRDALVHSPKKELMIISFNSSFASYTNTGTSTTIEGSLHITRSKILDDKTTLICCAILKPLQQLTLQDYQQLVLFFSHERPLVGFTEISSSEIEVLKIAVQFYQHYDSLLNTRTRFGARDNVKTHFSQLSKEIEEKVYTLEELGLALRLACLFKLIHFQNQLITQNTMASTGWNAQSFCSTQSRPVLDGDTATCEQLIADLAKTLGLGVSEQLGCR